MELADAVPRIPQCHSNRYIIEPTENMATRTVLQFVIDAIKTRMDFLGLDNIDQLESRCKYKRGYGPTTHPGCRTPPDHQNADLVHDTPFVRRRPTNRTTAADARSQPIQTLRIFHN